MTTCLPTLKQLQYWSLCPAFPRKSGEPSGGWFG
jgi:hypothetical protein